MTTQRQAQRTDPPPTLGDKIRLRYPRLLRLLQSRCQLSEQDALEALVGYQAFGISDGLPDDAVMIRFGGALAALRDAINQRHPRSA